MSRRIREIVEILSWYIKKHGLLRFIILSFVKLWRHINNEESVYVFDLYFPNILHKFLHTTKVSLRSYDSLASIPAADIDQLIKLKSEAVLYRFLNSFFNRNAKFWIVKKENNVVGVHWTLLGGFNGFYSLPISKRDAIILAVEVFPAFRGQNLWPQILNDTVSALKKEGISRVYIKVGIWNNPMLRSMKKIIGSRIGTVRTFHVFNRHITIWDQKSLDSFS